MSREAFLFTSESVSEGHPYKLYDRNSEPIVDLFFAADPHSRVTLETLATTNRMVLTGKVDEAKLKVALGDLMDLSPCGIRQHVDLSRPIYERMIAYGYFGRTPDNDGGFSWERLDLVEPLKAAFG